jgi:hypothetical protein
MNPTRRALITALPLAAVGSVLPGAVWRRWNQKSASALQTAVVVYESENPMSARFAQAFPANVRRFGLTHGGAMQLEELNELLADRSVAVAGLTRAASFLMFQRLAVDAGRAFAMSADHRMGDNLNADHVVRSGISGKSLAMYSNDAGWIESLASSMQSMAPLDKIVAGNGMSIGYDRGVPGGEVNARLHSWLAV